MRKWIPILILAAAQFVMVLDTTVMNVAISNVVEDLDTTVTQVQAAITLYTLVMAALMMIGGKLGDLFGRRRIFAVGVIVYGAGSLMTGLAPNINVLMIGWSGLEGIGAAMVIPSIAALTARNYEGTDRGLAYGIIGAMAAVGVALGPLIGGWVTEVATWRYVFFGEVVVLLGVVAMVGKIGDTPAPEERPRLDVVGGLLSAVGLALIVLGVLRIPQWGLIEPKGALTIAGQEVTPFGFSAVPFVIALGAVTMTMFFGWCKRREDAGRQPLLRADLLKIGQLRSGLSMLSMQMLVMNGIFFVLPLYLQIVLGKDALETGLAIMPISVTMLIAAMGAPRLGAKVAPRTIVWTGLGAMLLAAVGLLSTIDFELNETGFKISLAAFGLGIGLLASQLGNVIMSSVDESRASETGGLQGTAQNLGASLGTALIGAVLLSGLATATTDAVNADARVSKTVQQGVAQATDDGVDFLSAEQVEQAALDAGVPAGEATAVKEDYAQAQLEALKLAMFAAAFFSLLAMWVARRLPDKPLA